MNITKTYETKLLFYMSFKFTLNHLFTESCFASS